MQVETSTTFELSTYQDDFDWSNGLIEVTIMDSEEYQVSETASQLDFEVLDDDLNSVFFMVSSASVVEGNDIVADLKVSPAIEQPFAVNLGYEIVG